MNNKAKIIFVALILVGLTGTASAQYNYGEEEDGDLSEWSGNTNYFQTATDYVTNGSYSVNWQHDSSRREVYKSIPTNSSVYKLRYRVKNFSSSVVNTELLYRTTGGTDIWGFYVRCNDFGIYWSTEGERTNGEQIKSSCSVGEYFTLSIKNIDTTNYNVDVYYNGNKMGTYSYHNTNVDKPPRFLLASNSGAGSANEYSMWSDGLFMEEGNSEPSFNSYSTTPGDWELDKSVDFSYNASDSDGTVENVTLEVFRDGSKQKEETFQYSNSSVEDTKTDWYTPTETGNFTVYFTVEDDNGAETVQTLEKEVTDNTVPDISYNPSTTDNGTYTRDWILVNVTATDNYNLTSATEKFNGTNSTFSSNVGDFYWTNQTNLSTGNYSFKAFAEDGAGNVNSTDIREVTLEDQDTTPPSTTSNWTSNTWESQSEALVELTAADASGVDTLNWTVDGGSEKTASGNTTITVSGDGNHTIRFQANDTNGNLAAIHEIHVSLDNTNPSGTLLSPENTTYQETSTADLNVTRSDATSGVDIDEYNLDGSGFSSFTPNTSITGLSEGQHSIQYRVSDIAGNQFTTAKRYFSINITEKFYVDTPPPGKAVSPASNPTANLSDWNNAVAEGPNDVLFSNTLGSEYAAELRINFTSNVSTRDVVVDTNRSSRKSVLHNTSSLADVKQKSLLIPRVNQSGEVHICPGAENLSATEFGCSNGYNISTGETVNGVSLSEVTVNGEDYYEAAGVSGTGGLEFAVASGDSDSSGSGGGGGSGPTTSGAVVSFSNPVVEVPSGGTRLVDVRINNSGIQAENRVEVSVPSVDSCRSVQVRSGTEFWKEASYTVAAESRETVENMVRVRLSDDFEGTGFSCELEATVSEGTAGSFIVTVERASGPLAWLSNTALEIPSSSLGGALDDEVEYIEVTMRHVVWLAVGSLIILIAGLAVRRAT